MNADQLGLLQENLEDGKLESARETQHGRWHNRLTIALVASTVGLLTVVLLCTHDINFEIQGVGGTHKSDPEIKRIEDMVALASLKELPSNMSMNTPNVSRETFWAEEETFLEEGHGFESAVYRGFVKFIGKLDSGLLSSLPSLVVKCKSGTFSDQQEHPVPTDLDHLNSACDRTKYQLEIQSQMMGDDFSQLHNMHVLS